MADTPVGVPAGDASLDGTSPSRVVVTTADKLRTLADWLDAHPGAHVSQVSFMDVGLGGPIRVTDYGAESPDDAKARAEEIGGDWVFGERRAILEARADVLPGFQFEIVAFRSGVWKA